MNPLPTYQRWLLDEHDLASLFSAQLATGQAAQVSARIQQEPASLLTLFSLLNSGHAALSVQIGIGVVLEDLAETGKLLQQPAVIQALGTLSQHRDARLRADACHYLGLTASRLAEPWLQTAVQDANADVRDSAAEALAHLPQP